jgi:hypothetical protein
VLHREQRRGGAARSADLRVDVLDVVASGLWRDHETLGDLLVRQPASDEPEDLDLARGESRRPLEAARDAVAGGAENRLDGTTVEPSRPDIGAQLGTGPARRRLPFDIPGIFVLCLNKRNG